MPVNDVPAWMTCEDMLNRAKNEFVTEAMEELNKMTQEKAIEINGSLVTLPDRPNDAERDMFVINKLLEEYPKIKEQYRDYINSNSQSELPAKVQNVERLKRFLLSLDTIAMLMHYGHAIDDWQHDIAMQVQVNEPSKIIANTLKGNAQRRNILEFALGSNTFEKGEIFTPGERQILEKARG